MFRLAVIIVSFLLNILLRRVVVFVITSWSRVRLEELVVSQLVRKLLAVYGNRMYISVFYLSN